VGVNSFTVSVNDGIAAAVQATLDITVTNVNDAPVFAADPINGSDATEDALYTGTIAGSASDDDSDPLTYAKVSGPAWLLVAADGTLSGTPDNADVGSDPFTVSVDDGTAAAVNATLNITVLNTNDAPVFAADPINGSDATEDAAYAGTIAGSASDDDSDPLTYAKVSGPAWLTVAANGALSGTPASSDVGANAFTVSVTDGIIATPLQATLNITVIGGATATADYALSEVTTFGTITGSLADADFSDNVYEILTEVESGGKPSKRYSLLEHEWTFNVIGGEFVTFYLEAHHDANSEGDDFVFAYSVDGTNYTDMVTVTKTTDDGTQQSYNMPGGLSGAVYVRVTDTNRTAGATLFDSLYVDEMFFLSEPATSAPDAATNPDPASGATGVSLTPTLTWTAGALAASHDVYFGTSPTLTGADFQGNQIDTSFSPGTLAMNTTYYWAVDELNGIGTTTGATWSFTTGAGTPQMHVTSIVLSTKKAGKDYNGVASVTIVDSGTGQPLSGATIYGDFTGAFGESGSAVTDASGVAVMTTGAKASLPYSFTFTVTDVTEAGHDYNPANNVETSDSGSF